MEEKKFFKKIFFFLISFFLVALGQPAFFSFLGIFSSFLGFSLFWKNFSFPSLTRRFLWSASWFGGVQLVQLSWMTSIEYQGYGILVIYFFLALLLGSQFGFLSLFVPSEEKNFSFLKIFSLASLWTLFEWSRLFYFSGFSWNPVGLALACHPTSLQMASVFGVFGLSFWVILSNLSSLQIFSFPKNFYKNAFFLIIILFPFVFGKIFLSIQKEAPSQKNTLSVLLIQTALNPEQKEPLLEHFKHFIYPTKQWERIFSLLKTFSHEKIDLIVFPESSLPLPAETPFYSLSWLKTSWQKFFEKDPFVSPPIPQTDPLLCSNLSIARALCHAFQTEIVLGLDDQEHKKSYNAAFYLSPSEILKKNRYEKRVLVPIAEYFPFSWCSKLASIYGITDAFSPGTEAKVFGKKTPLSISICYEETYGHLIRESREKGAKLLVNISNDVWFPHSRLARQHFEHGKLRAVENGIPLVRACNTGITGGIDSFGQEIKTLPENIFGILHLKVPLESHRTLYSFWGDFFIISLCSFFLFLEGMLWACRKIFKKKFIRNEE